MTTETGSSRTARLQLVVTTVGVLVAAFVGVTAFRRGARHESPPPAQAERVADWARFALTDRALTSDTGPVTLTVFTDYQCPFCRKLEDQLNVVVPRYPGQVRVVLRHFPLERIHPHARAAALAVECATAVGRRLAVHEALFSRQGVLGEVSWASIAADAGLHDTSAFAACVERGTFQGQIDEDIAAGRELRITGTPVVLVNDRLLRGVGPLDSLDQIVKAAIVRRRP